jgi:hypothetical protein
MARSTPWAILVCEFNDSGARTGSLEDLRNLYTDSGVGTGNIIDYFDTVSHGAIDLRGSQVFGWLDLDRPRTDYIGAAPDATTPAGKLNRRGLVAHAKSVAAQNDMDLAPFFSTLVLTTPSVDLFGNITPIGAVGATTTTPQLLLQEMGHNYGLEHSRSAQGPFESGEYGDPFDIMSGPNCQGFYGRYGLIGPGLSSANMRAVGWLDESRVLRLNKETDQFPVTVELRPLYARELSGHLAVAIDDTIITLRDPVGWDAGLPAAAVMVHYLDQGISFLHTGTNNQNTLAVGESWWWGSEYKTELPWLAAKVDAIDTTNRTATVTIRYRPGTGPHDDLTIEVLKPPWRLDREVLQLNQIREPRWQVLG